MIKRLGFFGKLNEFALQIDEISLLNALFNALGIVKTEVLFYLYPNQRSLR